MQSKEWLGLDIGGANLKAAFLGRGGVEVPFALWRNPEKLADNLKKLRGHFFGTTHIAVTMTGELCDCFQSKAEGVLHIIDAVQEAFADCQVFYWTTNGSWLNSTKAGFNPYSLAASNWLALAWWAAWNLVKKNALLIDMGSTTTDIIALQKNRVLSESRDDRSRLQSGELVYTGFTRTPVCAVVQELLCAELFANVLDAHLVLGEIKEESDRFDTADGRAWTIDCAHARLARMLGADQVTSSVNDRLCLARQVSDKQWDLIQHGIGKVMQVLPQPEAIILAGQGARWVGKNLEKFKGFNSPSIIYIDEVWQADLGRIACAQAVALLAESMVP
jgi:probable H4MPT-linked C1 transfer pathway protein